MKASEIIKEKLISAGGTATITLLNGQPCTIVLTHDGKAFTSDKLNNYKLKHSFEVFDIITQLLRNSNGHKAKKGNGRGENDKVGFGKCTEDTVMGTVAMHYYGKKLGESSFDPVFVLAAILDWANIAENKRGYIKLKL